jgi:hypothetical protein
MCLIKDGPFSPIRLFCHKYIETKRKSAKKKNGHRNNAMNSQKNKNRPILQGKIVLMILL